MKKYTLSAVVVILFVCCGFMPADWITVVNKEAGFKVSVPTQMKEQTETQHKRYGDLVMHAYTCDMSETNDENSKYIVDPQKSL